MKPKKGDLIIVAVIVVLAVSFGVFSMLFSISGKTLLIKYDNKIYKSYSLNNDGEYPIKTKSGLNKLVIKDGEAWFCDSDCPDKTCEKMGKIKNIGESIVCLPHKIVAEVVK